MIAAVLLGVGTVVSVLVIWLRGDRLSRWVPVGLMTGLVAGAALAVALGDRLSGRPHAAFVVVGLVAAAVGGSHLTTVVFEAVDEADVSEREAADELRDPLRDGFRDEIGEGRSLRTAGQVLRGGAWIGILERVAVFAALVARWPEGIAIVLAVKGLGRYPELRSGRSPGLAERFIIGTLVSVLWAALCAYAASGPALG
jgi:hypothetical protein